MTNAIPRNKMAPVDERMVSILIFVLSRILCDAFSPIAKPFRPAAAPTRACEMPEFVIPYYNTAQANLQLYPPFPAGLRVGHRGAGGSYSYQQEWEQLNRRKHKVEHDV